MEDIDLKKWMITALLVICGGVFSAALWISRIETTVERITQDVPDIKTDVTITRSVIADHSKELQAIRDSQSELIVTMDQIQNELMNRTQDRYYRTDADREWAFHRDREHKGQDGEVPHSHSFDEFGNQKRRVSP